MPDWIVGVMAVVASVVVAIITAWVTTRNTKIQTKSQVEALEKQVAAQERQLAAQERRADLQREDEAERVLRKYRDPLARASFDLQSRLHNIALGEFLEDYLRRGIESEQEYALESTLYVVGEYFGWVEILRREIQFLNLRDAGKNRMLSRLLDDVSRTFLTKLPDTTLRLFRNEQRAIGEVMMTAGAGGASRECIGYAAFVKWRGDPEFARWFASLELDVKLLATDPASHMGRLVALQHKLVDLLDFLDPDYQFFPEGQRQKIPIRDAPPA